MLATQISHLATNKQLDKWAVIKVTEYVCNVVNGKKFNFKKKKIVSCFRICKCVRVMATNRILLVPVLFFNAFFDWLRHGEKKKKKSNNKQKFRSHLLPRINSKVLKELHQMPTVNNTDLTRYLLIYLFLFVSFKLSIKAKEISSSPRNVDYYQPVSSLNPYQSNWRIKVRCTAKDPIRFYKKDNSEGKVFSVDLLDKDGGEIRATAFNETVDSLYPIFNKDGVYLISKGKVSLAKKGFTHIKNDFSIIMNEETEVELCREDSQIEKQKFKFIQIGSILDVQFGEFIDVIGCVESNKQKEVKRRTITLVDPTGKIELTLWDTSAELYDENRLHNQVVAVKGCR
ncbi:hypothetical protein RFI_10392, partial [Reticulomyxa filosa]